MTANDSAIAAREGCTITTNPADIPLEAALALLRSTYWARDMTGEALSRAMSGSMCFGVIRGGELLGFARVITDRATFAYLTDVVIHESARGTGLGGWLTDAIVAHPDLQGLRRFALLTKDKMDFYARHGFVEGAGVLTYMERR